MTASSELPAPVALPELGRRAEFLGALKDSSSVGLAMFPLGIAFGLLVVHSGLDWWWASAFSALIYAGSLEFLLVGLTVAMTPLAQVAVTTLLVNFRHVFYALSFPLHRVRGRAAKAYSTFAMTDEAYALSTSETGANWTGTRILFLQCLLHVYWVTAATAGALFGALLPMRLEGLDFALTALFVVLAIDAYRVRRDIPIPVLAVVCALVGMVLMPGQMLLVALGLFSACLLAHHFFARRTGRA
ncbi:AzlC family ABC transporter permease [Saccharopolyspora halophila]|uniref:AzlC family ABC transporter permease n=1 Tax=Saccharopolyspora halophila TaxID=405551 RepID=UPI0031E003B7